MRRTWMVALVALVASVALAACGSSSNSSGSSGSGGSSGSTATSGSSGSSGSSGGGSKGTIPVMQITQPIVNGQDLTLGTKAAVDAINASGGIDGYKLKYTFCQDGQPSNPLGDPNTTANCARQAVQDHDAAIVGDFSIYDTSIFPVATAAHIPVLIGPSGDPTDATNKDAYPVTESGFPILVGQSEVLAKEGGCKKISTITVSGIPSTTGIVDSVEAGAKAAGAQFEQPSLVTESDTDFSPSIAKLHSEGVDCIVSGFPSTAQLQPILQAIKSSGTNMKVSVNVDVLTNSAIKSIGPLLNGVYGSDTAYENALAGSDDAKDATPQEKTMLAAMKKYEPAALGQNHTAYPGYATVEVLKAAVQKVLAAHQSVSGSSITNALNSLKVTTGIVPPLDFSKPSTIKVMPRMFDTKVNLFVVKNGNLVALSHKAVDTAPAFNTYYQK